MPVKILFCYAHEDEQHFMKLKAQLSPLQHSSQIDTYCDRDINIGDDREQVINMHLNQSQIVVLLISPDFINSDYCYGVEMKRAIERYERSEAQVIPVILRHCLWQGTPLSKLQCLPTNAKPIIEWRPRDKGYFDVANGIQQTIERMITSSSGTAPQEQKNPSQQKRKDTRSVDAHKNACESLEEQQLGIKTKALSGVANGINKFVKEKTDQTPKIDRVLTGKDHLSIVEAYFENISELIRNNKLHESKPNDVLRSIARMQTLNVLGRLEADHKMHIIHFLSETGLIPIIDLRGADLREVWLSQLDLHNAHMREAKLSNAHLFAVNMTGADISGADLSYASLSEVNLSEADLIVTDLSHARLHTVNFSKANLNHAIFNGTYLSRAYLSDSNLLHVDMSSVQLDMAKMNTVELYVAQYHGADLGEGAITEEELSKITRCANIIKDTLGSIRDTNTPKQIEPQMFTREWYTQELTKAFDNLPD